jgi:multidrug efflux pump subunit AcrA (membrane-fusion protein)
MVPRTTPCNGQPRYYYVCSSYSKKADRCPAAKHYRAELVEETVARMLSDWFRDLDRAERYINQRIQAERDRLVSGDPDQQATALSDRIAKLERQKKNYRQQQAEDLISMAELREVLQDLEDQQRAAKAELDKLLNRKEYLDLLERDKQIVLAFYAGRMAAGLEFLSPEQRKDAYRRLHLTATIKDGMVTLDGWPDANYLPESDELDGWAEEVFTEARKRKPLQNHTNVSP